MQRIPPWVKPFFYTLVALGVLYVLVVAAEVIQLVVVAALLAYLLNPLVNRLERSGLSRTVATSILFACLTAVLGLLSYFTFPLLLAQLRQIQSGLSMEQGSAMVREVERFIEQNLAFIDLQELNLMHALQTWMYEHLAEAVNYVPGLVSLLGNLIIIPFMLFFLLKDSRSIRKGFISSVPNRYFELSLSVLHKMNVQLGNYLRGQAIDALLVGLLSILALWLIGVDYFIVIGLMAGLANIVPYVGPVAGAAVAVAVWTFTEGTLGGAAAIVGAFIFIQLLDNAVLSPLVVARNVKLHPMLVLIVVLLGGKFFGLLGLLLAVPVTAVVKVVFQELRDTLRRYRLA